MLHDAPVPRLCRLRKWTGQDGYGFELRGTPVEPGHFVGSVRPGGPADAAGLREGDRVVEVNGLNLEAEPKEVVVETIKSGLREVSLLVVDRSADEYYRARNITVSGSLPNVMVVECPDGPIAERMKPRLCTLKIWPDFIGYGFTVQSDQERRNAVVAQVDPVSPAELGGLKVGDKVVEINDVPAYTKEGEIPFDRFLALVRSSPDQLKLLVVEEKYYARFVALRSEGKYPDELLEVITCPDENPKRNEEIKFSIESPVSSVGRHSNAANTPLHSTPKRRESESADIAAAGKFNGGFVGDEVEPSPVKSRPETEAAMREEKKTETETGREERAPAEEKPELPVVLKYYEIAAVKGPLCFGFNVVAEKPRPGNYLENVERGSPAHRAGAADGDYLVAVNGALVYRSSHKDTVDAIKGSPSLVKMTVTDREGFDRIHAMGEKTVENLIDRTFDLKGFDEKEKKEKSSFAFPKTESANRSNENDEISANRSKSEDDSLSIDYKQVADEMVELALREAKQDNIKLSDDDDDDAERKEAHTAARSGGTPGTVSSGSMGDVSTNSSASSLVFAQSKESPGSQHRCPPSPLPLSSSAGESLPDQSDPKPVVIGGLRFSATAAEARRNMRKKRDVKNSGLSLAEKYDMLKAL